MPLFVSSLILQTVCFHIWHVPDRITTVTARETVLDNLSGAPATKHRNVAAVRYPPSSVQDSPKKIIATARMTVQSSLYGVLVQNRARTVMIQQTTEIMKL